MSDIKFECPTCHQHIQCEQGYAGMQIACPTCQGQMIVPTPAGMPAPAPAAAPGLRMSAAATAAPPAPPPPAPAQAGRTCPSCGAAVAPAALMCVKCGTNLRTGQKMAAPGRPGPRPAAAAAGPTVWYKTAYPYVGAYMVLLGILYLLGQGNPLMRLALLLAMAFYVVASHIITTVCAFMDDGAGKGILCFCIGIYAIYYVFKESERDFLKIIVAAECVLALVLKFLPLGSD